MQHIQIMPNTVSSGDVQRNYRKIFNKVKRSKKPIIVLTNNTPDVAIVDIKVLEKLYSQAYQNELNQVLEAIEDYKRAKKRGKLVKAKSLADFAK
jgi:PHD/YefM family antitoxin component YafN of YafNO toxin-antitoxin module